MVLLEKGSMPNNFNTQHEFPFGLEHFKKGLDNSKGAESQYVITDYSMTIVLLTVTAKGSLLIS